MDVGEAKNVGRMAALALRAAEQSEFMSIDETPMPEKGYFVPAGLCCVENALADLKETGQKLIDVLEHKPETVHFAFGIIEQDIAVIQFLEYAETQLDGLIRLKYWRDKWRAYGMPDEDIDVQFGGLIPVDSDEFQEFNFDA